MTIQNYPTQVAPLPASPSQAVEATPAPRINNIEPAKITKTRVTQAKRDIERAAESLDKALTHLASMAAGKENSENTTVQRVVSAVKIVGAADFRVAFDDVNEILDAVLSDLSDL